MYLSTLSDWLTWIASIHPADIELGLDRVKAVARRLDLLRPRYQIIIVGGTNGKGSTVAGIEAIYLTAGYQVGAFTSPFFTEFNEQIRIDQKLASNSELCDAFEKVNTARGDILLTSFEFGTLAALVVFQQYPLDVLILEVGLGGRLDAVNILEPDLSIVTSIALDHMEWLGATRALIAVEKAGIFRNAKPAICGDFDPPLSLIESAEKIGARIYYQGKDFSYEQNNQIDWRWKFSDILLTGLSLNSLKLQNMSTVLMAITLLQFHLPVSQDEINKGLQNIKIKGRVEVIEGAVSEVHDVSHNPAAVAYLAERLNELPCTGNTYAVFSMLSDKDITNSIQQIQNNIDGWYVAPLKVKRAASIEKLKLSFESTSITNIIYLNSIQEAYVHAKNKAQAGDRIVVFGSFHTLHELK